MATRREARWLAIAALPLAGVLFLIFTTVDGSQPVRVVEVKQEPLVSSLTTNGKVEPSESRELRAVVPGTVRRVLLKEGDSLRRGQLLAEMDAGPSRAEVARAQAELEEAEAELQAIEHGGSAGELHEIEQKLRQAQAQREEAARILAANERLLTRNAIARQEVEQSRERLRQAERDVAYLEQRSQKRYREEDRQRVRARVQSARTALAYTRQQLGSTRITAPIAGTIYSLPIRPGNFLRTGDLVARVGNLERARVRVFVDEPELGRPAPGQEVRVTWDALPSLEWKGTVERVPAEVRTLGTRNVGEVLCTIDNHDRKLLANVNVDVEIILERRPSALTLPREAVLHTAGGGDGPDGHYVFVADDNVLRRRAVKLGISDTTHHEIVSGIKAGETVALPEDHRLAGGMKVRVVE